MGDYLLRIRLRGLRISRGWLMKLNTAPGFHTTSRRGRSANTQSGLAQFDSPLVYRKLAVWQPKLGPRVDKASVVYGIIAQAPISPRYSY